MSIKDKIALRSRFSSNQYWDTRYKSGGNSGPGSYGHLAQFKASVINEFVAKNGISSVIEFGCGDGNQLTLAQYSRYSGYDISAAALNTCRSLFKGDSSKEFYSTLDYDGRKGDLAISLDVIFHLTEDPIFDAYMRRMFGAATRYVIIYSSNQDKQIEPASAHVRHRRFSDWIERELHSEWRIIKTIPNPHPYNGDYESTSFSDFYIYERL